MSRECPHCGLFSPDEASRCDCGYDFRAQALTPSCLAASVDQKADAASTATARPSRPIAVLIVMCIGLVVSATALKWLVPDDSLPNLLPVLGILLWAYSSLRLPDAGAESIQRGESGPIASPDRYVVPMSLVVVSMKVAESELVDVVLWVPALRNLTNVLSPEQVLGRLERPRKQGGRLEPGNFLEHETFVQLVHEIVEREAPNRRELQTVARRRKDGRFLLVDARVRDAPGYVPGQEPKPEDVIGTFEARDGLILPGSYQRNRQHRLLSEKGLFQLEYAVRERLKEEIVARHAFRQAGDVASPRVM